MKTEFNTKESLIKNLNLAGQTELVEASSRLGVSLEQYVESILFEDKTASFWIDSYLVNKRKDLYSVKNTKSCVEGKL